MASLLLHGLAFSWEAPGGGVPVADGSGVTPLQLRLVARLPESATAKPPSRPSMPRPTLEQASSTGAVAMGKRLQAAESAASLTAAGVQAGPVRADDPEAALTAASEPAVVEPIAAAESGVEAPVGYDEAEAGSDYASRIREAAVKLKRYPARARRFGLEGTAVVALVGTEGKVPAAVLVSSSGERLLDTAAVELLDSAARQVGDPGARILPLQFPVSYSLRERP